MESVYFENLLFIVSNEDGDVVADMDRDAAIKRMEEEYGGGLLRVEAFNVKVPRPGNYLASIIRQSADGSPIQPEPLTRVGDPPITIEATGELENILPGKPGA